VASEAGYAGKVVLSSSLYHARPEAIIDVLKGVPAGTRRVMIVGHNPGLEDLVVGLTGEHLGLPTAALVRIELPLEHWSDIALPAGGRVIESSSPRD
jgi:phosphohistidine phosphatase